MDLDAINAPRINIAAAIPLEMYQTIEQLRRYQAEQQAGRVPRSAIIQLLLEKGIEKIKEEVA